MDITLKGTHAQVGEKIILGTTNIPISKFCQVIAGECVTGMNPEPIPDNVRWVVERGPFAFYVLEFQPELRTVNWGEDGYSVGDGGDDWIFEKGQGASPYTVATPYLVMTVPFYHNNLYGSPCVFYRNEPLGSLDDPLCMTNLFNVSGSACLGNPNLDYQKMSRHEVLNEIVHTWWSGEFNGHMPGSDWHRFTDHTSDTRLLSIEAWQEASLADPQFVLGVNWLKTNYTLRNMIKSSFHNISGGLAPGTSTQLNNLLLMAK